MKKVIILYRSPKILSNTGADEFIHSNLREVFEDYVTCESCFMADLKENQMLYADAFLAVDEKVFQRAKDYITDFNNVIKMNRSIEASVLKVIQDIPKGTTALVVNDSYSTAINTINMFYEIGISHLNMIPFDRKLTNTGIYDGLSLAITPAEKHFVPTHIKRIIDIGYRKVSFDTMFRLMKLLNLDNSIISRNIFRYAYTLAKPNPSFDRNYIYEYLKSEMLSYVTNFNDACVFLTDRQMQIIYANKKAEQLSKGMGGVSVNPDQFVELGLKAEEGVKNVCVTLNGKNYHYDAFPIRLVDEVIGYYIILEEQNQKPIVNRMNHQKGYVAKHHFQDIVYESEEIKKSIQIAKKMSLSEYTVLIYGESGTGKELFAQAIHNDSRRANAPFVAVNCAALPESLLESELFGYEPGAFTGANPKGKIGLFEQANHGTVFLDEIGDISLNMQAKLLRVVQERQVMRIGNDRIIDVDIRLIAATNKDLRIAVREKSFRSDLFYRLNILPFQIPPLRKRKEDIVPLLKFFLGSDYYGLTPKAVERLTSYTWPGNVREIENFCAYYKTLSTFPEYLFEDDYSSDDCLSTTEAQMEILKLIGQNTKLSHGVGRNVLVKLLNKQGLHISDRTLRSLLEKLQQEGCVEIGKGRGGTRITQKGSDLLKESKQ